MYLVFDRLLYLCDNYKDDPLIPKCRSYLLDLQNNMHTHYMQCFSLPGGPAWSNGELWGRNGGRRSQGFEGLTGWRFFWLGILTQRKLGKGRSARGGQQENGY